MIWLPSFLGHENMWLCYSKLSEFFRVHTSYQIQFVFLTIEWAPEENACISERLPRASLWSLKHFSNFTHLVNFLNIVLCTKPLSVVVAFQTLLAMVHKWNKCIRGKGSSKMCHLQGNDWQCFWYLKMITFLCVWFLDISWVDQINIICHSVYTVNFSRKWTYKWLNYIYGVCTLNCYQQRDHLTIFNLSNSCLP